MTAMICEMVVTLEDRLVVGEDSALRDLFDEFSPLVLSICRRLVGDDAEDVAQQVFLAAWRGRTSFDPSKGSIAAWLAGISRFKAIDYLRAKGRRPSTPDGTIGELQAVEPRVNQVVDQILVAGALSTLPPARRQVITLGFYEGLSHPEIAERLSLPLGTVKSHMRRGLEAMQRELEGSYGS